LITGLASWRANYTYIIYWLLGIARHTVCTLSWGTTCTSCATADHSHQIAGVCCWVERILGTALWTGRVRTTNSTICNVTGWACLYYYFGI